MAPQKFWAFFSKTVYKKLKGQTIGTWWHATGCFEEWSINLYFRISLQGELPGGYLPHAIFFVIRGPSMSSCLPPPQEVAKKTNFFSIFTAQKLHQASPSKLATGPGQHPLYCSACISVLHFFRAGKKIYADWNNVILFAFRHRSQFRSDRCRRTKLLAATPLPPDSGIQVWQQKCQSVYDLQHILFCGFIIVIVFSYILMF